MIDYLLFVFSLSHIEDDLSQWRSYTHDSFGFALKLNFTESFNSAQSHFMDSNQSSTK
jgi:hypothetical protein